MKGYELTVAYWDQVFEKMRPYNPQINLAQPELEDALEWLAHDARNILDFGCGTGHMLLRLMHKGVLRGIGVDISNGAIFKANETARRYGMENRAFFLQGSLRCLHELEAAGFQGALLFNVLDNLLPDDAIDLIKHLHRLLAYRGRMLLKINGYEDPEEMDQHSGYHKVEKNLYLEKTGLYFWNLSNEEIEDLLAPYFYVENMQLVHFPQYGIEERLFFLRVM